MDKFALVMAWHGHQPVGNFNSVFAKAVAECYRPVVEILAEYPEFHCALHFSGPLTTWLEANDPRFLEQVAELAGRDQVEIFSGGFYEPLLASIPARDAVAQLNLATAYTEERFGQVPKGFWLAERIWEPGLPAKLSPAGMRYTFVDDTHLYYAGLGPDQMFGYHLTEREGHTLGLFPTHKVLRYTIPFKEPGETLGFMHETLDRLGPTCVSYGDDIEKFGLWPGTHEWVLEKGWLRRFIEAVLGASDWLVTMTPGQYFNTNGPTSQVYLPTASYEEMLTWALPAEASLELERLIKTLQQEGRFDQMRRFIRGGLWDNFLTKYRESGLMHKRMLHLSQKLERENASDEARDHLYQAQCNCAYWHGLFGGLYLCHLRQAVHEHLIAADSLCDQAQGEDWAVAEVKDLDLDGRDEVILASPVMDLVVHPARGGSVSVLDLRPQRFNLAATLTRRPEAYHAHIAEEHAQDDGGEGPKSIHDLVVMKEEGLADYLIYDPVDRAMFQDRCLPPEATVEGLRRSEVGDLGDLLAGAYELEGSGVDGDRAFCRLRRQGTLSWGEESQPVGVFKSYSLQGGRLRVEYRVSASRVPPGAWFAVEINFTFLSASDPGRRVVLQGGEALSLDGLHDRESVSSLDLIDEGDAIHLRLNLDHPARVWLYPVETVSQSESGLERTYQGSSLTLLWPLMAGEQRPGLSLELVD